MILNVLFIEDDEKLRTNLLKNYDGEQFGLHILSATGTGSFSDGIELIKKTDYDLIIVDLYQDANGAKDDAAGVKVLDIIKLTVFAPVIFYTGHAHKVKHLVSDVVGVVSKGDGVEALSAEIGRVIQSKLALLKGNIHFHIREQLRSYFWETIDKEKGLFNTKDADYSLGYLLLRRLANSLSKENIKLLTGDDKIRSDKAHPMEFYIYPSNPGEYEAGEILSRNGELFTVLTPTCDFALRTKKNGATERKVGQVLLSRIGPLAAYPQFAAYKEKPAKDTKNALSSLIKNNDSDRYFFLPGTPFIENSIIDFQNKIMVAYEELTSFNRIAKLDDPMAQSMISSFIRFYNRIGFPDIDAEYVINKL